MILKKSTKLCIFSLFFMQACYGGDTFEQTIKKYGFSFEKVALPNLKLSAVRERSGTTIHFVDFSGTSADGTKLTIELTYPIEKEIATQDAIAKLKVIENIYGLQPTPYQGEIANSSICPAKYHPQKLGIENKALISAPLLARASARLVWGNCTANNNATMGTTAFFYSPSAKKMLRLDFFQPELKFNKALVQKIYSNVKIFE